MVAMHRVLVFLFFAFFSLTSFHNVLSATTEIAPEERPMDFVLVHNGDCETGCIQWISAEGAIKAETPKLFRKLLKRLDGKKLPVVLQSDGGDVDAALAIGRMIRKAGLETAIGRTKLADCPMMDPRCQEKIVKNGWSEGEVHAGSAACFSACPFLFAGGVIRTTADNVYIAVHHVTTTTRTYRKTKSGKIVIRETSTTKFDPAFKRTLSAYFSDMGVSQDIFAIMVLSPTDELNYIQSEQALKLGITTRLFLDSEEPGYSVCGSNAQPSPSCHVAQVANFANITVSGGSPQK